MSSILLADQSEPPENNKQEIKKENNVKINMFQGRTEAEQGHAKFPNWDIMPPNQFINPRIKTQ